MLCCLAFISLSTLAQGTRLLVKSNSLIFKALRGVQANAYEIDDFINATYSWGLPVPEALLPWHSPSPCRAANKEGSARLGLLYQQKLL